MAVVATTSSVKVVLKLSEGSQTISGCNQAATDANLYALGKAVSGLIKEDLENVSKVIESTLTEQA